MYVVTFDPLYQDTHDQAISLFAVTTASVLCALMLGVVRMHCVVISDSRHVIMITCVDIVFVYSCNVCRNRGYLLTVLVQLGSDPALIQLLRGMTNERVILLGSCEQCQPCAVERRCVLGKEGHQHYPDILMVSASLIQEN